MYKRLVMKEGEGGGTIIYINPDFGGGKTTQQ